MPSWPTFRVRSAPSWVNRDVGQEGRPNSCPTVASEGSVPWSTANLIDHEPSENEGRGDAKHPRHEIFHACDASNFWTVGPDTRRLPRLGLLLADAALLHFVQQRLVADAEMIRSLSTVPAEPVERLLNGRAFGAHRGFARELRQTDRAARGSGFGSAAASVGRLRVLWLGRSAGPPQRAAGKSRRAAATDSGGSRRRWRRHRGRGMLDSAFARARFSSASTSPSSCRITNRLMTFSSSRTLPGQA